MTARLLPVGAFVCLFREALESDPLYADLWLEGEVSDVSRSSAGHVYFSLRDDDGCLKCVLFRGQALRQHHTLRFGDQVVVHGGLSIYPRSGAIQLIADLVQPAGFGAALLELEYLRQRLDAEGLFDPLRKRPLPASPGTIGVMTSSTSSAAATRSPTWFYHRLKCRAMGPRRASCGPCKHFRMKQTSTSLSSLGEAARPMTSQRSTTN